MRGLGTVINVGAVLVGRCGRSPAGAPSLRARETVMNGWVPLTIGHRSVDASECQPAGCQEPPAGKIVESSSDREMVEALANRFEARARRGPLHLHTGFVTAVSCSASVHAVCDPSMTRAGDVSSWP